MNLAAIFGCSGPVLTGAERDFFRAAQPWGFILFARNIEDAAQLRALTADLRAAVGWSAPIFIDQEGGRVARLRAPLAREWTPPLDMAEAAGENAARAYWLRYRIIAAELMSYGIDGNCAPMADVARADTHPFLRNRCYGQDAATVAANARACAEGHLDGGVLPVLKHIPGHGLARVDSHLDLPRVDVDAETLTNVDFAAFKALNDLPLGMTAHLVFEALDDQPATLSPKMMGLIRNEIGFDGLIMTDDISMGALSGTVARRSERAIAAGCDVVLHCNGDLTEMESIANVCGDLTEAAIVRADRALAMRRTPSDIDISALEADLSALLNG
ncbi:glycoside hydrolase family 3 protein [Donghicola sp. C2-DW-16]|uniref:beta-N-acetylhexosaminidase n=1 Tax=Donghicola mangrovi TaxID=2729614 RepID=A0ABX2PDB7_9RHOB|nr:glycoside hydrolase family 3 protein [Donghicola mangrovi]NVO26837.1 glycoside hydrolase family 3 protein [Donghicola mangrovi]